MNLLLCISLGVCAALPSDIFWYSMGRLRGGKVLSLIRRISLEPDSCVPRTENIYGRFGARALLVIKFIPGLSGVSTPLAGVIHMRLSRFLLFSGVGILIWVGAYTLIGYVFSEELERALAYVMGMGRTLSVLVIGGLMIYILRKYVIRGLDRGIQKALEIMDSRVRGMTAFLNLSIYGQSLNRDIEVESRIVKTLAFVMSLVIIAVGAVGILAPLYS